MSQNDDANRPADRVFRTAGPGHQFTRSCIKCSRNLWNQGGGSIMRGTRLWVCGECTAAKKARAA